jgi:hypothetical protein
MVIRLQGVKEITRSEDGKHLILWFEKGDAATCPPAVYVEVENTVYIENGEVRIEK